jgi:hypothetical protein
MKITASIFLALNLAVIILMLVPASAIALNIWNSSLSHSFRNEPIGGLPSFEGMAIRISFNELRDLAEKNNLKLFLPTFMPNQIQLIAIYRLEDNFMLCYSNIEVENYRYANITVEIRKAYSTPSVEDLRQIAAADPDGDTKILNIDDTWVVVVEKAHWGYAELEQLYGPSPLAYFWRSGHYYMVSVTLPITSDQLIDIIRSFKPLIG